MTKTQTKQIQKIAKNTNIKYLYLFGSQARGDVKPRSDFDFAVKFDNKKIKDTFKAKLKLMNDLTQVVKKEEVDVVNVEEVDPILNFNIIKDGIVIYERDRSERIMDKVKVMSTYHDRNHYYERHFKQKLNHLANKGMYE